MRLRYVVSSGDSLPALWVRSQRSLPPAAAAERSGADARSGTIRLRGVVTFLRPGPSRLVLPKTENPLLHIRSWVEDVPAHLDAGRPVVDVPPVADCGWEGPEQRGDLGRCQEVGGRR